MRFRTYLWLFSVFALLTVSVVQAEDEGDDENDDDKTEEKEEESDVLVLTKENFDQTINENDNVMVEFYAPWCGHCKTLEPLYAKAAQVLKTWDPPVPLCKVDATVETELAARFDVSGYPTIKFFKKGEAYDYDDARTTEGLIRYVKERSASDWKPPPEAVVTLTKDNFKDFVNGNDLSLVEFYAPWCGHCKALAPAYEKAAKQLKIQTEPIPLGKVDATVESELAAEYEVSGYPTLFLFRKGKKYEYNGPRDENGIVNYMIMQQGEASKLKLSMRDVKSSMKVDEPFIMGFFDNLNDPKVRIYMDAANTMREEFSFGHTFDPAISDAYKTNPGTVLVFTPERYYTKFEPKWHIMKLDDVEDEGPIVEFVRKRELPLVGQYKANNIKVYQKYRPLCFIFYTVDWSFDHREATQLWRNKAAKIANNHKEVKFAIADEDEHSHLLAEFGLDDSGEEINIACYGPDGKKFPMEPMEEWDSEDIEEFITKMKKGKLTPHLKSQPVPKRQDSPVKTVVAKNFDKVVLDKSKDVLIELYAPWCGHCKQLEPIYKDLATKVKKEKNLVIAKMDATANDVHPGYQAEGFPTIYFAPSNSKESPLKYNGGRTVDDFMKYLKEHATVAFKGKDEL
ncbi:protein disulfide-isomerase A4-like [Crassostrea virginica]